MLDENPCDLLLSKVCKPGVKVTISPSSTKPTSGIFSHCNPNPVIHLARVYTSCDFLHILNPHLAFGTSSLSEWFSRLEQNNVHIGENKVWRWKTTSQAPIRLGFILNFCFYFFSTTVSCIQILYAD